MEQTAKTQPRLPRGEQRPAVHTEPIVVIGGRRFQGITQELPAAQDHYLIGQLRLAGALEYIERGLRENGSAQGARVDAASPLRATEDACEGLLIRILVSGRAGYVLAGCLTEVGQKWTVEAADRNAQMFDAVRDAESKEALRGSLLDVVLGFFRFATASVAISRKSSSLN